FGTCVIDGLARAERDRALEVAAPLSHTAAHRAQNLRAPPAAHPARFFIGARRARDCGVHLGFAGTGDGADQFTVEGIAQLVGVGCTARPAVDEERICWNRHGKYLAQNLPLKPLITAFRMLRAAPIYRALVPFKKERGRGSLKPPETGQILSNRTGP